MTTKEIKAAIKSGHVVTLGDNPHSRICCDLFGELIVISSQNDEAPTRLATLADKRKAVVKTSKD